MSENVPPILANKHFDEASTFTPENLLREARRQKAALDATVPAICILDPDGDIVRELKKNDRARPLAGWVFYHIELYCFQGWGVDYGIVGRAVGSSFAALDAEELFVSDCELLISVTSSGQISPLRAPLYFILIERALRDEGTSYHDLPPETYSNASECNLGNLQGRRSGDRSPGPVARRQARSQDAF